MLKGVTLALTGLVTVFALTVGQANLVPVARSDQAAAAGALVIWSEPGFSGSFAVVYEEDIPTDCSVAPPLGAVGSANNATSGARVSRVEFYSAATCATATRVATLVAREPSGIAADIGGHATHYRGVLTSPPG